MEFLAPKQQSIMDNYKSYEAELLISSLTKDLQSPKEKLIKIISNFRSELIFAQTVFKFIIKEYLGQNGPIRIKQASYILGEFLLLAIIWIQNGFADKESSTWSIGIALWFLLSILTFFYGFVINENGVHFYKVILSFQHT